MVESKTFNIFLNILTGMFIQTDHHLFVYPDLGWNHCLAQDKLHRLFTAGLSEISGTGRVIDTEKYTLHNILRRRAAGKGG